MKDFQSATTAAADRIGAFFTALAARRAASEKKDDSARLAHLLRRFFNALIPAAFAALLGSVRLPLSVCPLGLAVTAAGVSDTPALACGVLLGALLGGNIPIMAGGMVLLLLRIVFSLVFDPRRASLVPARLFTKERWKACFREGESLRLCSAAVAAFTAGTVRLFAGGFSVGDLVGVCFSVLICPAITYLYTGYTTAAVKRSPRCIIGHIALLVSFIFALSSFQLPLNFSVSVTAATGLSLFCARRRDLLTTGVLGLLFGFAAMPAASPGIALGAMLFSAAVAHLPLALGAFAAAAAFSVLCLLAGGSALLFSILPEFLLGVGLSFFSFEKAERMIPCLGRETARDTESAVASYREKSERETLRELSKTFEALSSTFAELSDRETRLDLFDVRRLCDKVCDRFCRHCAACILCWERDYAVTLDTLNKISAKLYKHGKVSRTDLPPEFIARCTSADRMLDEIEHENAKLLRELFAGDGSRRSAVDYAVFSRVLSDALARGDAAYTPDAAGRDAVVAALTKIGFSADSLGVFGTRQKQVYAFRIGGGALHCTADAITAALESALGGRFAPPLFEFADGGINMIVKGAPTFAAEASIASVAGGGGEENGDRVHSFAAKNGCFYAVVNDGMGSGRVAADKSTRAALFLEKMLCAGNDVTAALELLSAMARNDREEGFTTVDLFMLDGFTGQGSFFKSGAAPSFVKRGERIFKIRSRTVPIGILEDVDAEKTAFACEDGDAVVMLSDGVTEDIEEPLWLCELICGTDLAAADAASRILAEAKKHTLCRDDMSAAVLRIRKLPSAGTGESPAEQTPNESCG